MLGAHLAVISVLRTNTWQSWVPVLGLAMLAGGCVLGSTHRSAISVGTVSTGFALQFWFGVLVTRTDAGSWALSYVSCLMTTLLKYAGLGAAFVFTGRDLPDGNYRELESSGAKQKTDSKVVVVTGITNVNAWILTTSPTALVSSSR